MSIKDKLYRLFKRKNNASFINSGGSIENDGGYLIDFRAERFHGAGLVTTTNLFSAQVAESYQTEKTVKVSVKPIDVLKDLEKRPSNWSLEGLSDKILMMEEKIELITQKYSKEESEGLLLCLKNRRKFDRKCKAAGGRTYREYFSQFDETDEIKIDVLLKKYSLVMKPADIFIPEFPADATKTMSVVTKITMELCKKKPRLFVIANKDQFRDADGKRDPILLAQSPFGFYYYILGAWDKEMLYLPEL